MAFEKILVLKASNTIQKPKKKIENWKGLANSEENFQELVDLTQKKTGRHAPETETKAPSIEHSEM